MSCRALEQVLLLRAHGQLGGVRRVWLDSHLRHCPACRELWARYVLEKDAMRRALTPPAEVDASAERLMTAVAVRIRTEPRETLPSTAASFSFPRKPSRLLALGVLVLLLACGAAALAALGPLAATIASIPTPWRTGTDPCVPKILGPGPDGVLYYPGPKPRPVKPADVGKPNLRLQMLPAAPKPADAKQSESSCLFGGEGKNR